MLAPDQEDFYPYYEDTVTESDWHVVAIHYLFGAFREHLRDRTDAWAFSNMFIYDQEGNRNRKVSPDVFVAFGCGRHSRRVFRTWLDGGPPVAVFEVTSRTSRKLDQSTKRSRYAEMGVQEYFLFDPLDEYIPGQFRAYRREGGELVPVLTQGRYTSGLLGVEMVVEGELLRLLDAGTGLPYLTTAESWARADAERRRAEAAHIRAEAEHSRAEAEHSRAEAEHSRAEAEHSRAEAERARADALEQRLRWLEQGPE